MIKLYYTRRFKKDYRRLPAHLQDLVDAKLTFLLNDPRHPSLRVHKIRRRPGWFELSVTTNYRVVFEVEGDVYRLLAVGTHRIIDRI